MKLFLKRILALSTIVLSVLACGKDELDDGGEKINLSDQEAEEYNSIAQLMSSLCGQEFDLEDVVGLKGKTFEPTYGEVYDQTNSFERTVLVKSAEMAESYFTGLVGWNGDCLEETGDGFIIRFPETGFGTLEFSRIGDGSNVGYATVDIPSIPHLQKIIYKTKDQIGENAGYFESPCLYGEVYVHDGRYYICVRESSGYNDGGKGVLVCMEAGKGSYWQSYCSEQWGCWKPKSTWRDSQYITDYLYLCADPSFTQQKKRIVKTYPGKVFPTCQYWPARDKQTNIGDTTWGFGNLEPGYSHVTRYHANFADEKSNSAKDPSKWQNVRAVICCDASKGSYRASKARWWRQFHHFIIPYICTYDRGLSYHTHRYVTSGEWNDFFTKNTGIIYTMNVTTFNDKVPAGYSLIDI